MKNNTSVLEFDLKKTNIRHHDIEAEFLKGFTTKVRACKYHCQKSCLEMGGC